MKRLVVFSLFLAGFIGVSHAAVPQQRRGAATAGAASNASSGAPAVSARAAVNRGRTAPAAGTSSGVSARSATSPRGTVVRAPSTASSGSGKSSVSARAAATQKVIQTGTKVQAATQNTVVSEACRTKYEGCMDSFCMLDNANGGRCQCSDRVTELNKILAEIENLDMKSYQMATTGVERIKMGDDADEVIAQANAVANSIGGADKGKQKRSTPGAELNLGDWNLTGLDEDEDPFGMSQAKSDIENSTGDALFTAAAKLCVAQMPECAGEMNMIQLMYGQKIKSDCTAFENSLKQQKNASAQKLQTAERALRDAALESYREANKYDLGECTLEFKKCMQTTGGCGEDFSACAGIAATDKLTDKKSKQFKIKGATTTIMIAASTYDTLMGKQPLCMSVTKKCSRVKDQVWDTFLQEVAPQLRSAELIAESNMRTSCISDISNCIQKACKDNIDPNDPDGSYDLCLTNPKTVENLCKVQVEPCKIAEPDIMDYVYARLSAMRIDSCTQDVKECLQSEDRCGKDYTQCLGLDMDTIASLCPQDKLIGCKKAGEKGNDDISKLKMDEDYKQLVYGIFLSIDNALIDECQNLANEKMIELCGDTQSCDAFITDNVIGTESLISYTNGNNYIIDGLMSYSDVKLKKIGDGTGNLYSEYTDGSVVKLGTYEIDVSDYIDTSLKDYSQETKDRIEAALQATANKINQKIAILTSDPKISMCVYGRDLRNINGTAHTNTNDKETSADGTKTTRKTEADARFPHLLDSSIMVIISSGLDRAGVNYANKLDTLVGESMENQSDDVKTAMCAALAMNPDQTDTTAYGNLISADSKIEKGQMTIAGVDKSQLLKISASGKGEWVLTDTGGEDGNMIGRIVKTAAYSSKNNTCTVTSQVETCEDMEFVYDTTNLKLKKAKRGASVSFGGTSLNGVGGSDGLFSQSTNKIEVSGKKIKGLSVTSKTFRGQACKKFAEPQVSTQTIKM